MKKILISLLLTIIIITASVLPACSQNRLYSEGDGELEIVTTFFPPFDFAREVAKDKATVTILQDNGADLHNYSPTTATLTALSRADIFICTGGVSDEKWINDAISSANNPDLTVIKMTDITGGTSAGLEGHNHGPYCEGNHSYTHQEHPEDDGHVHETDEHVWTSPGNAALIVEKIRDACSEKDPENAEFYKANAESYISSLLSLEAQFEEAAEASEKKTVVFADRFPFVYLTEDLGLCYYAAFSGCSTEVDASFETQSRLIEAVKDNSLSYVIVTESSDQELAAAIQEATGCGIVTLDSMQSVNRAQIEDGATYLRFTEKNLEELKKALG